MHESGVEGQKESYGVRGAREIPIGVEVRRIMSASPAATITVRVDTFGVARVGPVRFVHTRIAHVAGHIDYPRGPVGESHRIGVTMTRSIFGVPA